MDRPVVQGGRIEVRSIRPHQRADFRIDPDLLEQPLVTQWAVQLASQNRPEVDGLLGGVVKANAERVRRNDFKRANAVKWGGS
jgi:hypothetical protein